MPAHDSAPTGAPCWVDVYTSDPDKAETFYGELFGWTADTAGEEFGGYINFSKDGALVAGAVKNDGHSGTPDVWSVYLSTDDAKVTVDEAAANGGQVIVPAMDVGDLGTMAVLSDPGGAAIGAWQPGTHKGFGLLAEPGAPAWFELSTKNFDASVAFYEKVFHWETHPFSESPEMRYTTLGKDEGAMAGVMDAAPFLPEGVPSHWTVYFAVADVEATLARAVDLGGTVLEPAENSPHGRIARLGDPTGAAFKVVGPNI